MKRAVLLAGLVVLSCLWCRPTAHAAQVTLQITGVVEQVSDASGLLSPAITVGSPFSGILIYDSSVVDSLPGDPELGSYFQVSPSGVLIGTGGYAFETTSASTFRIDVRNDASDLLFQGDSIGFSANEMLGPVAFDLLGASLFLSDVGGTALNSDQLPSSINASAFGDRWIDILGIAGGTRETGPTTLGIRLRPDSFSAVPEPNPLVSMSLGAALLALASVASRRRLFS